MFANFAKRTHLRIKEPRKTIIIIALPIIAIDNSRILDFVESRKITNSRECRHAKITRYALLCKNKITTFKLFTSMEQLRP